MEPSHQALNPWISMWTKPRATLQQIIATDPEQSVILLASLYGIAKALDRASIRSIGDHFEWPYIVMIAVIMGPIGGIIYLYLVSALIRWVGQWLGGTASPQHVRAALAWSCVPVIWALVLWIPQLVFFGQEMFTTATPVLDSSPALSLLMLILSVIEIVVGIWVWVVVVKSLALVQGFSAWKALGNLILALLVVWVPIMVVFFGFYHVVQ